MWEIKSGLQSKVPPVPTKQEWSNTSILISSDHETSKLRNSLTEIALRRNSLEMLQPSPVLKMKQLNLLNWKNIPTRAVSRHWQWKDLFPTWVIQLLLHWPSRGFSFCPTWAANNFYTSPPKNHLRQVLPYDTVYPEKQLMAPGERKQGGLPSVRLSISSRETSGLRIVSPRLAPKPSTLTLLRQWEWAQQRQISLSSFVSFSLYQSTS